MTSTIQQFAYRIVAPKKTDERFRPFKAIVRISLQDYSPDPNDDWPILSHHLMSEGEIDGYIAEMKKDLDRVGKLAKKALNRANARTLAILREREAEKAKADKNED